MIQKKSLKEAIKNPEIISVVGGLLSANTSFINAIGAIRKLPLNSYNDINDIKETSFSQFSYNTSNLPKPIGGHVLTICQSDVRRMQLYMSDSSVYIRGYFDTKWYNWMKLYE